MASLNSQDANFILKIAKFDAIELHFRIIPKNAALNREYMSLFLPPYRRNMLTTHQFYMGDNRGDSNKLLRHRPPHLTTIYKTPHSMVQVNYVYFPGLATYLNYNNRAKLTVLCNVPSRLSTKTHQPFPTQMQNNDAVTMH